KLLLEARDLLGHGQWLPWLKEHCRIPERTARRYIEIARYTPDEIGQLADLTLELPPAPAEPDWDDSNSISAWANRRLDEPFCPADFWDEDEDDKSLGLKLEWIATKLKHQADIPVIADWCFSVADVMENGRPPLVLCPWDDLVETAKALAPIADKH